MSWASALLDASAQMPFLLEELRDLITKQDLEFHRMVIQELELSSQASNKAASINQEVMEVQGILPAPSDTSVKTPL